MPLATVSDATAIETRRRQSALSSLGVRRTPASATGWRGSQTDRPAAEPLAVVHPADADEVVATIDWARRHRVPLTTFSSGPGAHERGLTAIEPTLVMDLSAMQQVLHVDARDAIAVIEPGVTFSTLNAALSPVGLRAFAPLAPRPNKSVIASALEREPILQAHAHWDVLDPFGAAEIVFGTGERFRTGSAAIAGSMAQHQAAGLRYLTAFGPATTDFMRVLQGAQGTLGTVVWAAVMCERVPAVEHCVFVRDQDATRLTQLLAWVHWRRLGNAGFLGNALQFASLAQRDASGIPALARSLPPWAVWLRLGHGGSEFPQEQIDCELQELQDKAASLGLSVEPALDGLRAEAIGTLLDNRAGDLYPDRLTGAHRSVFCLQQLDKLPALVRAAQAVMARHSWPVERLAVYVQPRLQGRNAHVEFVLPCEPEAVGRPGGPHEARAPAAALAQALSAAGGFLSRPYGDWAPMAYARNLALQPYLRQTKALFDPDRILNPGRLCY